MSKKLGRDELVELVRKIANSEGSEAEIDGWIELLEQNVPHPEVTGLIFYPDGDELTPEEVVDRALAYKPIQL